MLNHDILIQESILSKGHMEHEEGVLRDALPFEHDPIRRWERLPGDARSEQADDGILPERGQLLHDRSHIRLYCDGA